MFCQACGAALTKGLTYCNRCGSRVASAALTQQKTDKLAEVVFCLAVFTGVVGLGGLAFVYFLVRELLGLGFEQSRIMVVTFFCLLAVVGLASMLAQQLSRALGVFLRAAEGDGQPEAAASAATPELAGRQTAQIEAPREPAASVTDNTTRTFDPVYQERRS